jgi:hypothetical protein
LRALRASTRWAEPIRAFCADPPPPPWTSPPPSLSNCGYALISFFLFLHLTSGETSLRALRARTLWADPIRAFCAELISAATVAPTPWVDPGDDGLPPSSEAAPSCVCACMCVCGRVCGPFYSPWGAFAVASCVFVAVYISACGEGQTAHSSSEHKLKPIPRLRPSVCTLLGASHLVVVVG